MMQGQPLQVSKSYSSLPSGGSSAFIDGFIGNIQHHIAQQRADASSNAHLPPRALPSTRRRRHRRRSASTVRTSPAVIQTTRDLLRASVSSSSSPATRGARPATAGAVSTRQQRRPVSRTTERLGLPPELFPDSPESVDAPLLHPCDVKYSSRPGSAADGSMIQHTCTGPTASTRPAVVVNTAHTLDGIPSFTGFSHTNSVTTPVTPVSGSGAMERSVSRRATSPYFDRSMSRSQLQSNSVAMLRDESLVNTGDVDPSRMTVDLLYQLLKTAGAAIGVTSGGMEKLLSIPQEINDAIFHEADDPQDASMVVTTPFFELARHHRLRKAKRDAERERLLSAIAAAKAKSAATVEETQRRTAQTTQETAIAKRERVSTAKVDFHLRVTTHEVQSAQQYLADSEKELAQTKVKQANAEARLQAATKAAPALREHVAFMQDKVEEAAAELRRQEQRVEALKRKRKADEEAAIARAALATNKRGSYLKYSASARPVYGAPRVSTLKPAPSMLRRQNSSPRVGRRR